MMNREGTGRGLLYSISELLEGQPYLVLLIVTICKGLRAETIKPGFLEHRFQSHKSCVVEVIFS